MAVNMNFRESPVNYRMFDDAAGASDCLKFSTHFQKETKIRRPHYEVIITEEPAPKSSRFRYECEGPFAGTIFGVSSTDEIKTFPKIKIIGGPPRRGIVVVSCVTKDAPYRSHPHNLVGRNCNKGVCTIKIYPDTMSATLDNVGIQCVKRKDIVSSLKMRQDIRVNPFKSIPETVTEKLSFDFGAVRLCFQVFLEDEIIPGKFKYPLKPKLSAPIFDKRVTKDLNIVKLSDCVCCVDGGRKYIIMICEKVVRGDVQLRFFELQNSQVTWEDFATIQVHKQIALLFKPPQYKTLDITHPVRVYIQLRRPSDGATSDSVPFDFLPLNSVEYVNTYYQEYRHLPEMNRYEEEVPRNQVTHPLQERYHENAYSTIITEQPAPHSVRFRYECEGRTSATIMGVSSTPINKTYPTIKVVGGPPAKATVVVSCVTKDAPYRPHPYNLVGQFCKKGVCTTEIPIETMSVTFENLGIQCVKKKDVENSLKIRKEIRVDPFRTGFQLDKPLNIDLNALRLCFQVFLKNENIPGKYFLINPVVSAPIYNKKVLNNLNILKLSDSVSYVDGGKKDVILLCEKVVKEDIEVRLYELRNSQVIWEALADINVYKSYSIWFKIPKYQCLAITEPVKIYIQLRRCVDGACSDPIPFTLLPLEKGNNYQCFGRNIPKTKYYKYQDWNIPIINNYQHQDRNMPTTSNNLHQEMNVPATNNYQSQGMNIPTTSNYRPQEMNIHTTSNYRPQEMNIPTTSNYQHQERYIPTATNNQPEDLDLPSADSVELIRRMTNVDDYLPQLNSLSLSDIS